MALSSGGIRLAASPRISSSRTRARFSIRSESRSARTRSRTMSRASRAWSRIWGRVSRLSRVRIRNLGLCEHLIPEVRAQEPRGVQVDLAAEDAAQLLLHGEEAQPGDVPRLEFNENVHVAIRPEIVPQHRPEEAEPADVIPPAELGEL